MPGSRGGRKGFSSLWWCWFTQPQDAIRVIISDRQPLTSHCPPPPWGRQGIRACSDREAWGTERPSSISQPSLHHPPPGLGGLGCSSSEPAVSPEARLPTASWDTAAAGDRRELPTALQKQAAWHLGPQALQGRIPESPSPQGTALPMVPSQGASQPTGTSSGSQGLRSRRWTLNLQGALSNRFGHQGIGGPQRQLEYGMEGGDCDPGHEGS